jgi:hypothetical protein
MNRKAGAFVRLGLHVFQVRSMPDTNDLPAFYAWMDELNAEAVRRGLDPDRWPLTAHRENCWLVDCRAGLTPAQALDQN